MWQLKNFWHGFPFRQAALHSAPYPPASALPGSDSITGSTHGALSAWYLCPDDEVEFHAFDKTELTPAVPTDTTDSDVQSVVAEMKVGFFFQLVTPPPHLVFFFGVGHTAISRIIRLFDAAIE